MAYALRSFEYWAYSYRRVWRGSVVTSIVGPVLYLTALGIGLGKLVNRGPGVGVPYLQFVAPGILAATAMQLAVYVAVLVITFVLMRFSASQPQAAQPA